MIICWVEKEVPEPWGLGRGEKWIFIYLLRCPVETVPLLDNPDLSMTVTIYKSYNPLLPTYNFHIVKWF